MNLACGQADFSVCKQILLGGAVPELCFGCSGEKGADLGSGIGRNGGDGSLGDDVTAPGSRLRAHFHNPVRFLENLGVMVYENDGVAVGYQVAHDPGQTHNIRWMQADRGFVQHIEHTGGAVADGSGQLHSLAFAGGQGGGRAIQGQVAEA